MILQKLVGNIYSVFIEFLLWLIPIAGFVAMGIILSDWGSSFHIGYGILGLVAGMILDIILYGYALDAS